MEKFDFLIVGAGFAGTVLAERIASRLGKTCLIVEKRHDIGAILTIITMRPVSASTITGRTISAPIRIEWSVI